MNSNTGDTITDGMQLEDDKFTVEQCITILLHGYEYDPGITYRIDCGEDTYVLLSRLSVDGDCDLPTEYEQQCVATVWTENGDEDEPDARITGTFRNLSHVISMMRGDRFGGPFE